MRGVIPFLIKLQLKRRLEYRGAFFLGLIALIVGYSGAFIGLWLIARRFGALGGWSWAEVAFLYGFHLFSYASGAALSWVQMSQLETTVREGKLDPLLVKPMSPWAYLVFSGIELNYLAHLVYSACILAWAAVQLDLAWTLPRVAYLGAAWLGGMLTHLSLITLIGSLAFRTQTTRPWYHFYFSVWEFSRLPLNMFPAAIQGLLLTLIPLGYASYLPVAWLLEKDPLWVGRTGALLAPLAGFFLAAVTVWVWRKNLRGYEGAGS